MAKKKKVIAYTTAGAVVLSSGVIATAVAVTETQKTQAKNDQIKQLHARLYELQQKLKTTYANLNDEQMDELNHNGFNTILCVQDNEKITDLNKLHELVIEYQKHQQMVDEKITSEKSNLINQITQLLNTIEKNKNKLNEYQKSSPEYNEIDFSPIKTINERLSELTASELKEKQHSLIEINSKLEKLLTKNEPVKPAEDNKVSKLEQLKNEVTDLQNQMNAKFKQLNEYQKSLEDFKNILQELLTLELTNKSTTELNELKDKFNKQISLLDNLLTKKEPVEDNSELIKEIQKLQKDIKTKFDNSQASINSQPGFAELNQELLTKSTDNPAKDDLNKFKQDLQDFETKLDKLISDYQTQERLKNEVTSLQTQMNAKFNQLNEYQKSLEDFKNANQELLTLELTNKSTTELNELKDKFNNQISLLDNLLTKVKPIEDNSELIKEIQKLQKDIKTKFDNSQASINSQPGFAELNQELLIKSTDNLAKDDLNKFKRDLQEFETKLDKLISDYQAQETLKNEVTDLQNQMNAKFKQLNEYQKSLEDFKNVNQELLTLELANKSTTELNELKDKFNNQISLLDNLLTKTKPIEDNSELIKEIQKLQKDLKTKFDNSQANINSQPGFAELNQELLTKSTDNLSKDDLNKLKQDLKEFETKLDKLISDYQTQEQARQAKINTAKELQRKLSTELNKLTNYQKSLPEYNQIEWDLVNKETKNLTTTELETLITSLNNNITRTEELLKKQDTTKVKTYQLMDLQKFMSLMNNRLNSYQKNLPKYQDVELTLLKQQIPNEVTQFEFNELKSKLETNIKTLQELAKEHSADEKINDDHSVNEKLEFSKESKDKYEIQDYPKTEFDNFYGNNKNKLEIINEYSREDIAKNVPVAYTKVANLDNFPGYPSLTNDWRSLDSEFAKKTHSTTNEELKNNRIIWQRLIKQGDCDTKYVKNESMLMFTPPFDSWHNQDNIIRKINENRFDKHPSSINAFGDLSVQPTQKAVTAKWTVSPTFWGTTPIGLYAPAGEVITIQLPKSQLDSLKKMNLKIVIGQEFEDNESGRDGETGNTAPRFAKMRTAFDLERIFKNPTQHQFITKDGIEYVQFKIGSSFGGTISFICKNDQVSSNDYSSNPDLTFTISGAVRNLHYINGVTTAQEWKDMIENTRTPIFTATGDGVTAYLIGYKRNLQDWIYSAGKNVDTPYQYFSKINASAKISKYMTAQLRDRWAKAGAQQYWLTKDFDFTGGIYAHNVGGAFFVLPLGDSGEILSTSDQTFQPNFNWGVMHEMNHSYEWNVFGYNKPREVTNNVNSVLEYGMFSPITAYRSEDLPIGTGEWGWGSRSIPFTSIKNQTMNSAQGYNTGDDVTDSLFMLVQTLGPKYWMEFTRLQYLFGYPEQNFFKNYVNDPEVEKLLNVYAQTSPLSTAYLACLVAGIDLTDWFEHNKTWADFALKNNTLISKEELQATWVKLKAIIQARYPKFTPITNMYASGIFLPQANNTWSYSGDMVRPYQVAYDKPTVFDMDKWTYINNYENKKIKIKSAKVLNKPTIGTVKNIDATKIEYTPNANLKINELDYLEVQLIDEYDREFHVVIRPLLAYKFENSFTVTKYTIPENSWLELNGEYLAWSNSEQYKNDLKKTGINNYALRSTDTNVRNKLKLFANFNEFRKQNNIVSTTQSFNTKAQSPIKTNIENINTNNNIIKVQTSFVPMQSGFYRTDVAVDNREGYVLVVINDKSTNNAKVVQATNVLYHLNKNLTNNGQINFELEAGKLYDIQLFIVSKQTNNATVQDIELNYLGTENLSNDQLKNKQFKNILKTSNYANEEVFAQYGTNIFQLQANCKPRYYSWALENMDIFKYDFNTWKTNAANDEKTFTTEKYIKPGTIRHNVTQPVQVDDQVSSNVKLNFENIFDDSNEVNNWKAKQTGMDEVTFEFEVTKPFFVKGFDYSNIGNIKNRPNMIEIRSAVDQNGTVKDLIWNGEINGWNVATDQYLGYNKATTTFNEGILFAGKMSIRLYRDLSLASQVQSSSSDTLFRYSYLHFNMGNPRYDYLIGVNSKNVNFEGTHQFTDENTRVNNAKVTLSGLNSKMIVELDEDVDKIALFGDRFNRGALYDVSIEQEGQTTLTRSVYDTWTSREKELFNVPLVELNELPKGKKKLIIKLTNARTPLTIQYIATKRTLVKHS
ncbi:M60 family metallopeptidase [Mycoplasma hafezii]|uniref:M60 family metallopeptidase n=1 Tax=Mycoplasma hafezii TaxID=525886 RepID=UPI003CE6FAAD